MSATLEKPLVIYEMGDIEYWAARLSPEEMLAFYLNLTGATQEEATGSEDELPRPLTEEEISKIKVAIFDTPGVPDGDVLPIMEYIQILQDHGTEFPELVCTKE